MPGIAKEIAVIKQTIGELKATVESHIGLPRTGRKHVKHFRVGERSREEPTWASTIRLLLEKCSTSIHNVEERLQKHPDLYDGDESNSQPSPEENRPELVEEHHSVQNNSGHVPISLATNDGQILQNSLGPVDTPVAANGTRSCQFSSFIPYSIEDGVVVLAPSISQYRDIPLLLSEAQKLGARETGVFKYRLPDDLDLATTAVRKDIMKVSRFSSYFDSRGLQRISRTEQMEAIMTGNLEAQPAEPAKIAEILEQRLTDPEAMSRMRYCTDIPAQTAGDRRRLGLPKESPIWPVKDNQLERTRDQIPGVHWPYGYIAGEYGSLFATHIEDGNLVSMNAMYGGSATLWNVVAPNDGYLIEGQVTGTCAQKVRHASLWMRRSNLKAIGASFVSFVQRPKEVVLVWGDAFHGGGTPGPKVAEAVNYAPPNWSIKGYAECGSECDGFPISNASLEFRDADTPQGEQWEDLAQRNQPETSSRRNHAVSRTREPAAKPAVDGGLRKRSQDAPTPLERRPKRVCVAPSATVAHSGPSSNLISHMVQAIHCRDAILQFMDIVRGRRSIDPTVLRTNQNDGGISILNALDEVSNKIKYHQFLTRLHQARLAQDATKYMGSRHRVPKGLISKILRGTGMTARQYYYHRSQGTGWQKYQEVFPGILGFLLFHPMSFQFSSQDWITLSKVELMALKDQVNPERIATLCTAGKLFEKSLLEQSADDVDYMWENTSAPVDKLSDKDLLASLQKFPSTDVNIYDKDAYPKWPKPNRSPTNLYWPCDDPTSVSPSARTQCELCNESQCECTNIRLETPPRIRMYEGKGRGLQAVARHAGQVAYKKGDLLGKFTGVLTPPKACSNGRCIEILRHDLDDTKPVRVALINCEDRGNIFRLMNCDCEPTVEVSGMVISGKFELVVRARRDIRDGQELTFNYGRGYWGEKPCPCPKCTLRRSRAHNSVDVVMST
ncbi:uncharacterized protein PV06_11704 [Exophiala oligosperma]|uniref:SET domain-containing protein n=1 Tax=Exophiala oligosperma TaxID=215243 RepID=A0A0D2DJW0_9EURO|nr:uncharacterized protein PV06_11704 [Exophiala oligosperma]KIW35984.1 hypothetical protein PV06_11704 [Exophiala oligosperma]